MRISSLWLICLLWSCHDGAVLSSSAFSPSSTTNRRAMFGGNKGAPPFTTTATTITTTRASLQEDQQQTLSQEKEEEEDVSDSSDWNGAHDTKKDTAIATTTTRILANDKDFVKPQVDKRHYRAIQLDNGLRVLLVSCPRSDTQAAALHVQAGHFDDTRPGLAHCHEHVLFLGTQKYPSPDEFETYLASQGGSSNAYTDMEDTNYYLSVTAPSSQESENNGRQVSSDALEGALDRFAQFFISPLFDETMVEKELRAIDSEYRNSMTSDAWRNYQLLKNAASPDHPFYKFGCGNYKTLSGKNSENGNGPREDLIDFWNEYYQTYNMRLCVVGRASLNALQLSVEKTFGQLAPSDPCLYRRGKPLASPITEFPTEHGQYTTETGEPAIAFGKQNLGRMRETVPLQEARLVKLHFAAPPLDDSLLKSSRPYRVLSHILGHESPGSLHALLNNKGWLVGLTSGVGIDCSDFSFFTLTLSLTPDGMNHLEDVLDLVFEWIALLKGTSHDILKQYHNELRHISNFSFEFRENGDAVDFCSSAAELMFDYEPSVLLKGPTTAGEYDANVTEAFLNRMVPQNCLLSIVNSDVKVDNNDDTWNTEPWYKAQYRDTKLTTSQIEKWSHPPNMDPELHLPALNAYIPTDFSLKCEAVMSDSSTESTETVDETTVDVAIEHEEDTTTEKDIALELQPPRLLIGGKENDNNNHANLRLWHKMDSYWKVPKAYIRVSLLTPNVYRSPRSMTLNRIYQKVLNDDLNSFVYDASVAGCNYRVACVPSGFRISVKGYSEKLPFLLETLTTRMLTLIDELKQGNNPSLERKFNKAKESLLRETKNYRLDTPYEVASYNARIVLEESVWYIDNYVNVMEGEPPLTMQECAQVVEECLLGRLKAEALCIGNINEKEAHEVADVIDNVFLKQSQPLADVETPIFRSMKLPTRQETESIFGTTTTDATTSSPPLVYQELAFSESEENNAVELVLQCGCDMELGYEGVALLELISHMAYNSAFNQLRTVEQLGYIVSSSARKSAGGSWALSTVVQSSVAEPKQLEERMEVWLKQFQQEMKGMNPHDLATEAGAVVAQLLERDTRLSQEVGRAWSTIMATESLSDPLKENPPFDRLERLAAQLMVSESATDIRGMNGEATNGETLPNISRRQSPQELKQKVLDFFQHYFSKESPHRRVLSSRVYSQRFRDKYEQEMGKPGVLSTYDDIFDLKQYLSTWPTVPYWAEKQNTTTNKDTSLSKKETDVETR